MISATSEEWATLCGSQEAYSELAPAYLSVSVVREDRLNAKLVEMTKKYEALQAATIPLLAEFQTMIDTVSVFPHEVSGEYYSVNNAKAAIAKFNEDTK